MTICWLNQNHTRVSPPSWFGAVPRALIATSSHTPYLWVQASVPCRSTAQRLASCCAINILSVSFAATPCDVPRFGTDCFVVRTSPGFRYQICWERVLTKEHKGFGGQSWPRDPHHQNDRCASSCLYLMSVMPQYVIVIIAMRIDELSSPETVMIASTECCQAYREYQPIHN